MIIKYQNNIKIKYWNPYLQMSNYNKNSDNIFKNIFEILKNYIQDKQIYILGPMNKIGEQYIYLFNIELNEYDDIFFKLYTKERKEYHTLALKNNYNVKISNNKKQQKNSCELWNVSKNDINSGKDLIEWGKLIATVLGFNNMYLQDNSYITCPIRNKIFNKRNFMTPEHEFPLFILQVLKKRVGYYSSFNFYPYNNNINKKDKIENMINELFKSVNWNDFDIFFRNLNNTIKLINSGKNNIISKKTSLKKEDWKEYFKVIESNYNYLKTNFKQFNSPFYAFRYFDTKNCSFFIDWLEIFQITYKKFTTQNYNFYVENKIERIKIPGFEILLNINNELKGCKWICYNMNL